MAAALLGRLRVCEPLGAAVLRTRLAARARRARKRAFSGHETAFWHEIRPVSAQGSPCPQENPRSALLNSARSALPRAKTRFGGQKASRFLQSATSLGFGVGALEGRQRQGGKGAGIMSHSAKWQGVASLLGM